MNRNFLFGVFGILAVCGVTCGCSAKMVGINGQNYMVFNPESSLHSQYIKGYLSDYSGLIEGRAYGVPAANFVWLDTKVKFSNYDKLCIQDFENLTGKKSLKYDASDDVDISQVVTNAFFQGTQLRKLFKQIKKVKEGGACDGLVVTGAVTYADHGPFVNMVFAEISIQDGKSNSQLGKIVVSSSHMLFSAATNKLTEIFASIVERFWVTGPDFDPKIVVKVPDESQANLSEKNKLETIPSVEVTAKSNVLPKLDEKQPEIVQVKTTELIAPAKGLITETEPIPSSTLVVSENKTKMRKTPSKNAIVIKTLRKGVSVKVLKEKDEWFLVELPGGETGWCHKSTLGNTQ